MDIATRIKEIIAHYQLTSAGFAHKIGIQPSSVSHILSGRNKPSLDLIQKITASFTDVNTHWLITGENEMFTNVITNVNPKNKEPESPIITEKETEVSKAETILKSTPTLPKANTSKQKEVEKIVVFYTDKTFDIYKGN